MFQIKPMKKVHVSVGLVSGSMDSESKGETVSMSFLYGIRRDGLSAFECCIQGGCIGDHHLLSVKASEVAESFADLFTPVRGLLEGKIMPETIQFDIEILGIEKVDNREIVAALADSVAGCGSGDSCGCGCS